MTKIKGPTETELHNMIAEARRTVRDLKDGIRAALLAGAATGGLRDQLADTRSRMSGWAGLLEDAAEEKGKVVAARVAGLRLQIGVVATARVADMLAGLQPAPFPTVQTQGTPS